MGNSSEYRVFPPQIMELIDEYPASMKNPFKIMLRWLKFEMLDLEAILEAISKKNAMD